MTGTVVDNHQDDGDKSKDGTDSQGKVDLNSLPESVQTYIRSLRKESEGYRTAKEAAEAKAKELTDEVEAAQTASRTLSETAQKAQRALTIRDLRETYGLDAKADKFLTGETDEELKEQAEALSAFAVKPPENNDDQQNQQHRETDPAQQNQAKVDPEAERAEAFFGG